ncbi:MAG: ABC transporter ATP-binding protein/permease [Acidimicrobiia bacterium]|nr:ABC transporter ATP-binding protein/permease [Acidimicrobiia bacterium]
MTNRTKPTVSTGRLMLGMIRYAPWRYAANVTIWATMWLLPIIPALITRAYFDRLQTEPGFNATTLIAAMFAYGVARLTLMALGLWNDIHFGYRVTSLLRRNMLERIYDMPGAQAVHDSPGEMITRFREDVDHVEEALAWTPDLSGTLAFSIAAAAIMLAIDVRMTLLVFAPLVVMVITAERFGGRIRRYRTEAREATGRITGMLGETLGSVQSIKVAGAEASTMQQFRGLNETRRRMMVRDRVLTATLESVFWNLLNIGVGLILVVGASSMADGTLTIGDFALFVYFLDFVTDAGYFVGMFVAKYKQAGVSLERMSAILGDAPPSSLVEHRELHLTGELPAPGAAEDGHDRLRTLEIDGLTFAYPDSSAGIRDIHLTIPAGSFIVVTGRVGSGKTTLLRSLLGLVAPDAGEVRWNGRVVTDPDDFFAPPHSAYVAQVPRLFSMSLRDNLQLGRDDEDGELAAAIRSAAFDRDLDAMPKGLDTMIGPLGMRLSGGQVQRTATARMFVRRPDLLVIDDLSSALDVETERTLWDRLFTEHDGTTALVVSHRRPALQRADEIIVLEDGAVAARGTFDDLMVSLPEFRDLWAVDEPGESRVL